MAVYRVQRTRDYTVMSNYHLRDKNLTLKSKGLLSMILSLPDEWSWPRREPATGRGRALQSFSTSRSL